MISLSHPHSNKVGQVYSADWPTATCLPHFKVWLELSMRCMKGAEATRLGQGENQHQSQCPEWGGSSHTMALNFPSLQGHTVNCKHMKALWTPHWLCESWPHSHFRRAFLTTSNAHLWWEKENRSDTLEPLHDSFLDAITQHLTSLKPADGKALARDIHQMCKSQ